MTSPKRHMLDKTERIAGIAAVESLFDSIRIGPVELRNRLVMLATGLFLTNGPEVNEAVRAFYVERARGGVGMITVGTLAVLDFRFTNPNQVALLEDNNFAGLREHQIAIWDDSLVSGLRALVHDIHAEGAKAFAQLGISKYFKKEDNAVVELVGPSDFQLRGHPAPRPLTIDEIYMITRRAAEGAKRAKDAGFDGIEIQAAIGNLLSQFLSPLTNRRGDEYGGSLENRTRFVTDIVRAIKEEVGLEMPVTCKIGGDDFMDGGNKPEDAQKVAHLLEHEGVAAINVAAGWHESGVPFAVSMVPQGSYAYLAENIKRAVHIPVMATYRIVDPLVASRILEEGKADLIGMARALYADPDLPNKAKEGRFRDIRPCIACCRCLDEVFQGRQVVCSVNPRLGKESERRVNPAPHTKQVFIAGGGPAGMEAALTARLRGHDVTLYESGDKLGGQLLQASLPPFKSEIDGLKRSLSHDVLKSGVKVQLGNELTISRIEESRPDVVIVATGGDPEIPEIPGAAGKNVVTVPDVLLGRRPLGSIVTIIGGGMVGCETALFLAELGKKVTVIARHKLAADAGLSNRWVLMRQLKKAGISTWTDTQTLEISLKGVNVNAGDGAIFIPADMVVLAVGLAPRRLLANRLAGKFPVRIIGDCAEPRRIWEAMDEGYRVGSEI